MPKDEYKRKLAAILSADAQGYSRLMGEDENGTVQAIKSHLQSMSTLIESYRGRVVDSSGDNLLAEFPSVVDAVQCAAEIQETVKSRNVGLPETRRMVFRIGINLGDVIEEDGRIYGDGVSIAARLEHLADGGEICISGTVYEQVRNKLPFGYEDQGELSVKNIPVPIRVYKVLPEATEPRVRRSWRNTTRPWRRALLAAVPGVVVAVVAMALWGPSLRRAPPAVQDFTGRPTESPDPAPKTVPPQPGKPEIGKTSAGNLRQPAPPAKTNPEKLPGVPLPEPPSLAVLPFENLSGDPDQEYFSDGFTDDIITSLSKLPRLFVISKTSTFTYKGKPTKVEQISRDLGVRYVLEGSIQKNGSRLRINAQLLDGNTGKHIWAERYDRDAGEQFKTRDKLILDIAAALVGKLTDGDVAMIMRRNTDSLEAWEAMQRGHVFYERYKPADNLRAREWYRKSAELDPNYVNAWMNVGWTYYIEGRSFLTGEAREQAFDTAVELAKKIIEMNPSYYGGYMLLSGVNWRRSHHDEAIAFGRKAVEMEPNNTFPVAILGGIMAYGGQPEEAIVLFHRAMRLSPFYRPWYLDGLALAYHLTGHSDKAIETFRISAERDPKSVYPHVGLAVIYAEQVRDDEMRAEAAEVMRLNPKFTVDMWAKSHSFKDPKIHEYRKAMMIKAGLPE